MSDTPLSESSAMEESSTNQPTPFPRESGPSPLPTYAAVAALLLAVIAVVIAALVYFFPAQKAPSVAQQGGDAKANICSAFGTARKGWVYETNRRNPNPDDPIADLSVATSARLSLIGAGAYLRDRIAANTAAPADLRDTANSVANTVEQLGINYLAQATPAVQEQLDKDLGNQVGQLNKLCG